MRLYQASIVVAGAGFTPQVFRPEALGDVVAVEPTQTVCTPSVAVIDYPNGCHVQVTEDRLDVRRDAPVEPDHGVLAAVILRCLELWPLVHPTAVGLNFVLGRLYGGGVSEEGALGAFLNLPRIQGALGARPAASQHVFQFDGHGRRITLRAVPGAPLLGEPGIAID